MVRTGWWEGPVPHAAAVKGVVCRLLMPLRRTSVNNFIVNSLRLFLSACKQIWCLYVSTYVVLKINIGSH